MEIAQLMKTLLRFENLNFNGLEIYLGVTVLALLPMMLYLWVEHQEY